jgi:release factor glutamine methyltransferase
VLEGIQKSSEFLAKNGVESARLQAELLLARVLNVPRLQLYLKFERALAPAEVDRLRELVRRRGRREPWQHIAGTTSFCGLDLAVTAQALVPRPETELLAEAGWEYLATVDGPSPAALDFGTGSGCIAIALAVKCPTARVAASDISAEALDLARRNASTHSAAGRIEFVLGDGFAGLPEGVRFDLIISNPPYIPTAEIEALEPEVKDHDPRCALDGGADGLDFYRRLAAAAERFLRPGGRLMLEFGDGQSGAVAGILESQKWVVEAIREDYTHRPRFLIAKTG